MTLTNAQIDAIMYDYEMTRHMHIREQQIRMDEVYARLPMFRALDQEIPDVSLQFALARANGRDPGSLHEKLAEISAKKSRMLTEAGFPEDYLSLKYSCPKCLDTGYMEDGRRCSCLNNRIRSVLYEQSNLSALFDTNCFERLREDFYSGDDLARFRYAHETCLRMIDGFGRAEGYMNLLFFGSVGSGKSFLSISTAKELLDRGYSVLYFSAASLFETLADAAFDQTSAIDSKRIRNDLFGCDLLIIDDLGTELTNAFVSTQLFSLINERHVKQHATIISTNFDLEELRGRYSDRVFSRLISSYAVLELTGQDIRLLQRTGK